MKMSSLVLFGFGGHARSIADVAITCGYKELIFVDNNATEQEFFAEFPVQKSIPDAFANCFCAAGNNKLRREQFANAETNGWNIATLFSPHATRGIGSTINRGTVVAHHAHVGPMSVVGQGCIINTAAIVEHDCRIGNFSHVSVNATLTGRVKIGDNVFIGAGVVVRDGVIIGDNITIGAGATVVHDLHEPGVYVGTPAKLMSGRG